MQIIKYRFRPDDRLNTSDQQEYKPMTVPVFDAQKQTEENYQDQIENLNLKLLDQEDATRIAKELADQWERRNEELRDRMEINRNAAVVRCTSMESDVRNLQTNLKTEVGNRDHFRFLVSQQDAFIKESKLQIEEYKIKRDAELKSKTSESEHLAKQAIRLNEENSKLRKENTELTSKSNQLNTQTPLLMEENQKYREQTARIVEEKRKLEDHVELTDKALRFEKSIASYKDSIIETLERALAALDSISCISWRKQRQTYRDCMNTVAALRGNIDKLREQQKNGR